MSEVAAKLAELGVVLPVAAAPVGAYVPAVASGNLVLTSGQLPFVDGVLPATGKVGAAVSAEEAAGLARIAATNALAAIEGAIGSLDRVTRIVKATVFVSSDPSFTSHSTVGNGASELLVAVFGDAGKHARSSLGVAVLPLDSPVEVELIAEFA